MGKQTKRQHYISRCYQKWFSANGKSIYTYDKKLSKAYDAPMMSVCFENNLYTISDEFVARNNAEAGTSEINQYNDSATGVEIVHNLHLQTLAHQRLETPPLLPRKPLVRLLELRVGAFAEIIFDMNKFLKKLLLFAAVIVLAAASCTKGSAPGSNLDVPDPEGTLEVNRRNFKVDSENSYVRAEKLSVTVTVSL